MYLENISTIRNLSARFVTDSEKKLLSKGLDFAIFPQYLNILDVQAEFENLYHEQNREEKKNLYHFTRWKWKKISMVFSRQFRLVLVKR